MWVCAGGVPGRRGDRNRNRDVRGSQTSARKTRIAKSAKSHLAQLTAGAGIGTWAAIATGASRGPFHRNLAQREVAWGGKKKGRRSSLLAGRTAKRTGD